MSRKQPSGIPKLLNEPLAVTSTPHTSLMDLPNELLATIVELIGPPDASCCDPGWLVVPAICRRLREVVGKIAACWESGEIIGPDGGAREKYGWRTYSLYEKLQLHLPASAPDRQFSVSNKQNGRRLSFIPAYEGGNLKYLGASLSVSPGGDQVEEITPQGIDRYLGGSPLHGLPRPNLTWISSIYIMCHGEHADQKNFSFADVPCIVAPALQELYLSGYVVDWRCNSLKSLNIDMRGPSTGGLPEVYRYSASQLLARLHDSRLTLERVRLLDCLTTVPEDDCHRRRSPAEEFPCLRDLEIVDMSREASWLCARVGFPVTSPPLLEGYDRSAIGSLRSLACEYAHLVPDPKPALPGVHGELDALTFRNGSEYEGGSIVTASRITGIRKPWLRHDPTAILALYAQCCIARYVDYDAEQDVRNLDGRVPGIEPKFVTKLAWDLDAWNIAPRTSNSCGVHCSALHGIKHVFIEGFDTRLFKSDSSAEVWTSVLRHLPNVHSVYIYAPSSASLAPLIDDPDLLPELRTLWLGCDNESKGDDDADGDSSDSETDYDSESSYDSEGDDYSEEVYDLQNDDNGAEQNSAVESIEELTKDDGLKGGDDSEASCEPMNHGDKDALAPKESRFTAPRPKARKIDARTLVDIMTRRKQMEVQLVNLTIAGDLESIQACERLWEDGRIIVRTPFRV
ncbi:hypothetical protein PENSPDRAFT_647315 [Peniophora sp. CONT]|nr:hypothetical protein PENSPDRAFT_647315 [Peniophora sp. CONT]